MYLNIGTFIKEEDDMKDIGIKQAYKVMLKIAIEIIRNRRNNSY